jgi:hypothetical protein
MSEVTLETIQDSIDKVVESNNVAIDTVMVLSDSLDKRIADAVTTSVNGTVEPLIRVATNLVGTQALLITLISGGST